VLWEVVFYLAAVVMLVSAGALLFVREPMHAAVYLIASLIALAILFYLLGSPFVAVMQIILYVGAIMVLFVFMIMMMTPRQRVREDPRLRRGLWWPVLLLAILALEGALLLAARGTVGTEKPVMMIGPKAVGEALFRDHLIMVEVAALLLLAALAAVLYFGRKARR
jgi:NADH-quinone oxidoreductase subunit J